MDSAERYKKGAAHLYWKYIRLEIQGHIQILNRPECPY